MPPKDLSEINDLNLPETSFKTALARHLRCDRQGNPVETVSAMFRRVARAMAEVEKKYGKTEVEVEAIEEHFYEMISQLKFIPQSAFFMGAGRDRGVYSACFVLPLEDNVGQIFKTAQDAALIQKAGASQGFNLSPIRPRGDEVAGVGGLATGPVSFMRVFDTVTAVVHEGGLRRGGNMGILNVNHPDILDFISCKASGKDFLNFNISVGIGDDFMEALKNDLDYELINPRNGQVVKKIPAAVIWEEIARQAWATGDPGLIFLDTINEDNSLIEIGPIDAVNLCGEQPLHPYDVCNLGSINLSQFVRGLAVDYDALGEMISGAVRFLDNSIDANNYPIPEIAQTAQGNRRVGLGVMGFADLLFKLGVPYDSPEGLQLAEEVAGFIRQQAEAASSTLAQEKGAFPNFKKSTFKNGPKRRNAALLTVAPTGQTSMLAATTSGIEPLFALAYVKNVIEERGLVITNSQFEIVAKDRGFYSEELMRRVAESGSVQNIPEVPEDVRRVFVTAHDIEPTWHVRMQAAFQRHVDSGVSKTINLPNSATVEDIGAVYLLAYELDCKGITVYRDGCRPVQILRKVGDDQKIPSDSTAPVIQTKVKIKPLATELVETLAVVATGSLSPSPSLAEGQSIASPRPGVYRGATHRAATPQGTAFITLNRDDRGQLREVFVGVGKSGSDIAAFSEALGRLISVWLRSVSDPREAIPAIIDQLRGIGGSRSVGFGKDKIRSIPDAVAWVLERDAAVGVETDDYPPEPAPSGQERLPFTDLCPQCGRYSLVREEGCLKCYQCTYTEC